VSQTNENSDTANHGKARFVFRVLAGIISLLMLLTLHVGLRSLMDLGGLAVCVQLLVWWRRIRRGAWTDAGFFSQA